MNRSHKTWKLLIAGLAVCTLTIAACGGSDDDAVDSGADTETTVAAGGDTETTVAEDTETTMAEDGGDTDVVEPVGPACSAIPADGDGSTAGMADDPAATAASANPVLSTLVTAVTEAGLVDTLNDTSAEYTIFAPANTAFEAVPEDALTALLADKEALTNVLTFHVHAGEKLDAEALSGMDSLEMVNGGSVSLAMEGDTLMVNGQASVVCANVTTANATVHIIDSVLMPE